MAVSQKNSDLTIDSSVRESISSLMDNAAQPLELQRVLKASDNDEHVRLQWARYQLASAVLKKETTQASLSLSFADSVAQAIDAEPNCAPQNVDSATAVSKVSPKIRFFEKFWQPAAGLAVAASVTMVMVLGAQRLSVSALPEVMPAQQGIVLLEPGNSNDNIALFSTAGSSAGQLNTNDILRIQAPVQALNAAEADWLVDDLPEGFVLTHRTLNTSGLIPREELRYSNGVDSFKLYVEPLEGRTITQGHAFAGPNLVLGQSFSHDGKPMFITLVGQLSLLEGEQVANSVVSSISK